MPLNACIYLEEFSLQLLYNLLVNIKRMKTSFIVIFAIFMTIGLTEIVKIQNQHNVQYCVAGSYWSTVTVACATCASVQNSNGASLQHNKCGCVSTFAWNRNTFTCDSCTSNCPSASANIGQCAIGSFFSKSTNACVACSTISGSTGVSAKNGCECTTTPTPNYWDLISQSCAACPAAGCPVYPQRQRCPATYYLNRVSKLCDICPTDATTTGQSTKNGCSCVTGNYWDQTTQACIPCPNGLCPVPPQRDSHCLDGSYFNSAAGGCLTCSSDLNSNGASVQQNRCGCKATYYWDRTTQACIGCPSTGCPRSSNNGKCASGSYFNKANSGCQLCSSVTNSNNQSTGKSSCGCNSSHYWVNASQSCESCPTAGCPRSRSSDNNGRY